MCYRMQSWEEIEKATPDNIRTFEKVFGGRYGGSNESGSKASLEDGVLPCGHAHHAVMIKD